MVNRALALLRTGVIVCPLITAEASPPLSIPQPLPPPAPFPTTTSPASVYYLPLSPIPTPPSSTHLRVLPFTLSSTYTSTTADFLDWISFCLSILRHRPIHPRTPMF